MAFCQTAGMNENKASFSLPVSQQSGSLLTELNSSVPSHLFKNPQQRSNMYSTNKSNWKTQPETCPISPNQQAVKHPILNQLTSEILATFQNADPTYNYESTLNPKRVLTKPSKGTKNFGLDNDKSDFILYVGDIIGSEQQRKYRIMDILGQGTFGQVAKCQHVASGQIVAVKIIKNEHAYFNQSLMEVNILDLLNKKYDPFDKHHITRLLDTFVFKSHLCIVFELLSINLYELLKQNKHRGFSHSLIRKLLSQILDALCLLKEAKIVHCDLKPENILLRSIDCPEIKIIDFGSGCHENKTVYTYIQSRFYRSPEVILGLPYSSAIDMWSFGCIAMELFLGVPIFPGNSNYDQIKRITQTLGLPPNIVMEVGKDVSKYFIKLDSPRKYFLRSKELFERENGVTIGESKRYFSGISLDEIINLYPISRKKSEEEVSVERRTRDCFCDFVRGILNLNPLERWTPHQARKHPYLTGEEFTCSFNPSFTDISSGSFLEHDSSTMQPYSLARTGRPRAMTINSMRPQIPVPPSLEKISDIAGNVPASMPMIGERHYSIVADPQSYGDLEDSLMKNSQYPQASTCHNNNPVIFNPAMSYPSMNLLKFPPPSVYQPFCSQSLSQYRHPTVFPFSGNLPISYSDNSVSYNEQSAQSLINQRRISNPFGCTANYPHAINIHPYPVNLTPCDSSLPSSSAKPGNQCAVPSNQHYASSSSNESYLLDGYYATRKDSVPKDHHPQSKHQFKKSFGK